jgi:uncharacterized protein (TIGR02996 family)
MPRYELDGETWEIVQEAQLLHLDASGKQTTRKFVSPDHAAVQYTKLIAEKEAAGWKQVVGAPVSRGARNDVDEPREPSLEQHIIDSLDDRDAYAVYGDWYQTRQHPRGELIALQLAEETRGEDRKLHDVVVKHLARYKADLLGPLARHVASNGESPFVWRNGFIQGLIFTADDERPADLIREVLKHPSGRFLTSLELQLHDGHAIRDALAELGGARATMRDVHIRTGATLAGLGVFSEMPQLRTLSLATLAELALAPIEMRALAKLPASVEALHIRLGGTDRDWWDELAPLFVRDDLYIRKLSMRVPSLIDRILTAIAEGPFARRVEELDFALTDPDAGMRAFLAHRERFVKLVKVTASLDRITVEARNALKTVKKVVDVRRDNLQEQIGYDEDHYDEVQE